MNLNYLGLLSGPRCVFCGLVCSVLQEWLLGDIRATRRWAGSKCTRSLLMRGKKVETLLAQIY